MDKKKQEDDDDLDVLFVKCEICLQNYDSRYLHYECEKLAEIRNQTAEARKQTAIFEEIRDILKARWSS